MAELDRFRSQRWELKQEVFNQVTRKLGVPVIDMFATRSSREVHHFLARYHNNEAGEDVLTDPWPEGRGNYMYSVFHTSDGETTEQNKKGRSGGNTDSSILAVLTLVLRPSHRIIES